MNKAFGLTRVLVWAIAAAHLAVLPAQADEVPGHVIEAFGEQLVNAQGEAVSPAQLEGKKIGLYFSAEWCPPCRTFTPRLVEAYNELKEAGKPFEIIFVSHDRTEDAMLNYMQGYDMDWPAIAFDADKRDALKQQHGIRGIPTLIIVDDKGEVLSRDGRNEVTARGAEAFENW